MSDPLLIHPEDPDDDWQSQTQPKGMRLNVVTAGLVALAILAGGFWAGAVAEHHHNGSSSGSSALSALASRFASARGAGGFAGPGFGGSGVTGGGAATSGIVTEVQGNTLYVTDSSGNLIKVQVGTSTTVTRTAATPLSGLQVGDNVVVQGSKGSDGSVTATSVRASSAGSTPGGGTSAGGGAQQTAGSGGLFGGG